MNSNSSDHGSMPMNDGMQMGHSAMESSPDAAKQPYDLQFIDTMVVHHQGAIQMAEMVLTRSANDDLKNFAQKIIDDQTKEISTLKTWREKWYSGTPAAINMEMSGMKDSMKVMMGDEMKQMDSFSGAEFDIRFIDMMTPHHEGAVIMSKEALTSAEHPELKSFAAQVIKEQESEIKKMKDWRTKWSK